MHTFTLPGLPMTNRIYVQLTRLLSALLKAAKPHALNGIKVLRRKSKGTLKEDKERELPPSGTEGKFEMMIG